MGHTTGPLSTVVANVVLSSIPVGGEFELKAISLKWPNFKGGGGLFSACECNKANCARPKPPQTIYSINFGCPRLAQVWPRLTAHCVVLRQRTSNLCYEGWAAPNSMLALIQIWFIVTHPPTLGVEKRPRLAIKPKAHFEISPSIIFLYPWQPLKVTPCKI